RRGHDEEGAVEVSRHEGAAAQLDVRHLQLRADLGRDDAHPSTGSEKPRELSGSHAPSADEHGATPLEAEEDWIRLGHAALRESNRPLPASSASTSEALCSTASRSV